MIISVIHPDLEIRLLEPRHAPELFALTSRNRDHIRPWLPWADRNRSVEEVTEFIRVSLEELAQGVTIACAIFYKGNIAGGIGARIDGANHIASIGYWLSAEHVGQGLVTRSVRAFTNYLFHEYEFERIEIRCQVENSRSRAIPERLGFRNEGTFRSALRNSGRNVDLVVYSILRSEWDPA